MLSAVDVLVPNASVVPSSAVHHIITGSFRALSLVLLAFSPLNRTLDVVRHVPALGPHQYLATNANRNVVYATSWAQPPALSSWAVQSHPSWKVTLINTVPISSYLTFHNVSR
jgi:carboxy-cis,cis-muconate cyclase